MQILNYYSRDIQKHINKYGYVNEKDNPYVSDEEHIFQAIYNQLTLNDPSTSIILRPCSNRKRNAPILTTANKVDAFVGQTIQHNIAAARLTKSSFQNQSRSPSQHHSNHQNHRSNSKRTRPSIMFVVKFVV